MRCRASQVTIHALVILASCLWGASVALAQGPAAGSGVVESAGAAPRIELVTMGPGERVFARFGHAALCVFDDRSPKGRCYNYGTARFRDGGKLVWDSLQGRATFWLAVHSMARVKRTYTRQDRTLYKQVLPLTPQQARRLSERLAFDSRPENREFIYHHFRDNCSTRLRDQLDVITEGEFGAGVRGAESGSLRQFVRHGFGPSGPLLVASELLMGRVIDEPLDVWGAMFAPRILREQVEAHFGVKPTVVIERKGAPLESHPSKAIWLMVAMTLAFGVPLAAGAWFGGPRTRRGALIAGTSLMTLLALPGWTLAILSTEPELWFNEVLLLLVPLDGVMLRDQWRRFYLPVRLGVVALVAALALLGVFIQPLLGPIALSLSLLSPAIILTYRPTRDEVSSEGA